MLWKKITANKTNGNTWSHFPIIFHYTLYIILVMVTRMRLKMVTRTTLKMVTRMTIKKADLYDSQNGDRMTPKRWPVWLKNDDQNCDSIDYQNGDPYMTVKIVTVITFKLMNVLKSGQVCWTKFAICYISVKFLFLFHTATNWTANFPIVSQYSYTGVDSVPET
jgi:hypothetical protein